MMVVNWGAKSPMIYSVALNYDLTANGPTAPPPTGSRCSRAPRAAPFASPQGSYNVAGINPNGSSYSGRVNIARQGDRYRFDWRVGSSSYQGVGTLDGNVMVVNWGGSTPVVYALAADGTLKGLWSNGKATEILTPSR